MDVIARAAAALKPIADTGIDVAQGWYDGRRKDCHIKLWKLSAADGEHSDDNPETEHGDVQITIFSTKDEVELQKRVKQLMRAAGAFFLGEDQDAMEPQDGIYMKPSRYQFLEEA